MVSDDQVETEIPGPGSRLDPSDAAIDRDDQMHAERMQTIDRRWLQSISVAEALGKEVRDVCAQQLEGSAQDSPSR
jgi:hypothetical protein